MKTRTVVLWILQVICALILLKTSYTKLSSQASSIIIFSELGMEPTGRYLIGIIELLAAIFMLTNRLAATGAILALGTMMGALIAHITTLGFNVMGDHGRQVFMLAVVISSALTVTILRRKQLPLIGNTFED